MKQVVVGVLAVALCWVAVVPAQGQSARFGLGGGLTLPLSDYNTSDNAGWHILGKVDIKIPMTPVGVRVDGMYAQTTQKSPLTGNTKLAGGTADLVWHVATAVPGLKPYLVGGIGVYNHNPGGGSETKVAFDGGLGASVGVGPLHGFVEARYISVQLTGGSLTFVPVTVGLSFGS